MKIYCIFTVDTNENGETVITWLKHVFLFKEDAFYRAKYLGPKACVIELHESETWSFDEIQEESSEDI